MSLKISRRTFAATSLAALVHSSSTSDGQQPSGQQASGQQASGQQASDKWIDAHVHVWTPEIEKYPLDRHFDVDDMQPPSFTPQQLFKHCRPAGVEKVVLIQMSFYRFDNRYMTDMIAAYPGVFSGVGIVDHHAGDLVEQMKTLASKGVRGFRLHSRAGSARGWLKDAGMAELWKTARRQGLAVCPLINPDEIGIVDAMCHKYPETTVVVDHFARVGITGEIVPAELAALCELAKHPKVHVKTSAFYALGEKRPPYTDLKGMIRRVVDAFGPARLMWASDCPFQVQGPHDYQSSIGLIQDRIDFLSPEDKRHILRETAQRVFFA